jgi:hypothetical protein
MAPGHPAISGERCYRHPIWLLPNLLSLDAPLVAVCWQVLFAKSLGVLYLFFVLPPAFEPHGFRIIQRR